MRRVSCLFLAALFISCTQVRYSDTEYDKSPNIHNIVNRWTEIEKLFNTNAPEIRSETLIEAADDFYLSLKEFQESKLYRIYSAIPFLSQTERSLFLHPVTNIPEVGIVLDLALIFRDSVVFGDTEKAIAVSAEISRGSYRFTDN